MKTCRSDSWEFLKCWSTFLLRLTDLPEPGVSLVSSFTCFLAPWPNLGSYFMALRCLVMSPTLSVFFFVITFLRAAWGPKKSFSSLTFTYICDFPEINCGTGSNPVSPGTPSFPTVGIAEVLLFGSFSSCHLRPLGWLYFLAGKGSLASSVLKNSLTIVTMPALRGSVFLNNLIYSAFCFLNLASFTESRWRSSTRTFFSDRSIYRMKFVS